MNEPMPAEPSFSRRRLRMRSWLVRAIIGIVVAVVAIVLLIEFVGSGSSNSAQAEFVAGPADGFALADINAFEREHIFLVRSPDGSFRAFYDKSSKQQEIPGEGCRIIYDETAVPGTLPQIAGMRGAFVEDCAGLRSVWRVDGTYSFGSNYGDMDEFETRIDDAGNINVITDTRSCTRSTGVPGIPPFEERECSGAP